MLCGACWHCLQSARWAKRKPRVMRQVLCAETEISETHTLPPGVRAQTLSQEGSVVFPREVRGQNPCLLFLRVAYCRLGILKGAAQRCSARTKVRVKCSQLETRHFGKSFKTGFMFYFQNPDELYGSVGYCLQKGNVWWGEVGKEQLCGNIH